MDEQLTTGGQSATLRLRVKPGCKYGPGSTIPAGTEFDGTAAELVSFADKLEVVLAVGAPEPLPPSEQEPDAEESAPRTRTRRVKAAV